MNEQKNTNKVILLIILIVAIILVIGLVSILIITFMKPNSNTGENATGSTINNGEKSNVQKDVAIGKTVNAKELSAYNYGETVDIGVDIVRRKQH